MIDRRLVLILATVIVAGIGEARAQERIRVVTTLPTYASIVREIAKERADVVSIARGDIDPHFVHPRPSYAALIQRADLFVDTGLDLELWVPALLDRANNPRVKEGGAAHVVAYAGITLLEIPDTPSRIGGDVHVFGNPHIHTDPVNAIIIARNILEGLKRVDPSHASTYDANFGSFQTRILRRLFGDQLYEMLGEETLYQLASTGRFWDFAATQQLRGRPLADYVGGWLAVGQPFRDRRMVCYHKNWAYFSARFKVECAMFVEPKPGIPPSPGHVRDVIDFIASQHIPVLFAANYFSRTQIEQVASRAGTTSVIVAEHVDGEAGITDYFALVDSWVTRLATAFQQQRTGQD